MDAIFILVCVILLAVLSYKGLHILLSSFISIGLLCLLLQLDPVEAICGTMMKGTGKFITDYFLMFLLGAVLSELMKITGATESIATALHKIFGTKYVMIALCMLGTLICLGGISMYVAFFACTPIAISMLRKANLPRRLWIGAWTAGTCTYAMTGPFAPTMQNAVGVKYLGTTLSAGWQIGLIGWLPVAILILVYEHHSGVRARKRGETFIPREDDLVFDDVSAANLPHPILPCIPIALLFVMVNVLGLAIETGMLVAVVACVACLWNYLPHGKGTIAAMISRSFQNSFMAAINPAIIVGFAAVVTSTPTFASLADTVVALQWDPFITAAGLAGVAACLSGSCVAGLSVTFPTCVQMFGNAGINLETLHRVATMGAGTIDSLPHCGAIHGYASITKERVRDVYADVFFNSVICPIIATTISIIAAYLLGFAYV